MDRPIALNAARVRVVSPVNKIIVSVSDVSVVDSVIDYVPGIDIVILPNTLYANDEGSVRAVCARVCRVSNKRRILYVPGVHEVIQATYPQVRYMGWAGADSNQQPLLVVASGNFGRRLGRLGRSQLTVQHRCRYV
jgi:hypothetical protein